MRSPVGVTFKGDRRHIDKRRLGKSLLEFVKPHLALGDAEPPTVIVDHDVYVIGIVERSDTAFEGGIVEAPSRRRCLPDQPGEFAPILLVASAAAVGGEVILIPPL